MGVLGIPRRVLFSMVRGLVDYGACGGLPAARACDPTLSSHLTSILVFFSPLTYLFWIWFVHNRVSDGLRYGKWTVHQSWTDRAGYSRGGSQKQSWGLKLLVTNYNYCLFCSLLMSFYCELYSGITVSAWNSSLNYRPVAGFGHSHAFDWLYAQLRLRRVYCVCKLRTLSWHRPWWYGMVNGVLYCVCWVVARPRRHSFP